MNSCGTAAALPSANNRRIKGYCSISALWIRNAPYLLMGNRRGSTRADTYFTLDITDIAEEASNELLVRVRDYSDTSCYSRGKQKLDKGGMFYTAQSGIWQTVWLELVPIPIFRRSILRRIMTIPAAA